MYAYPVSRHASIVGTNPTPASSSTSSVSALRSSARLPRSVTCLSRSLRRTMRATRATPYVAKTSRACVPGSVIRAQDWTHTCVRCARWRGTFHDAGACFPNVHSPQHTQHARQMERRVLVPTSVRVVLHEALCHVHSGSPRDRRDATLYDAFALDTEPRRLAQRKASHRRRGARTSATCYTRGRARPRCLQRAVEHISGLYWCMLWFFVFFFFLHFGNVSTISLVPVI